MQPIKTNFIENIEKDIERIYSLLEVQSELNKRIFNHIDELKNKKKFFNLSKWRWF